MLLEVWVFPLTNDERVGHHAHGTTHYLLLLLLLLQLCSSCFTDPKPESKQTCPKMISETKGGKQS